MDSSSGENSRTEDSQMRRSNRQKPKRKQDQHEQASQRSRNASTLGDNPEILFKLLIEAFNKLWLQTKRMIHIVMNDLGGYQLIDRIAQWCVRHPQISLCFLAAGLVTFFPFLLLILFGLSTVVMTLTGFLVLEGSLLTFLSMIVLGLLGSLLLLLIFIAIVGTAVCFGFANIYDWYGGMESHRQALKNFLKR
uniref:Uncharacterized protein n=1 Tax=Glossina brevipalpis TaxID=37001 RepID=A0A1A9WAS2_9MUSC